MLAVHANLVKIGLFGDISVRFGALLFAGGNCPKLLTIRYSHNKYMVCYKERKKYAYQLIIKMDFP